jgi:hypothetical protein
LGCEGFWADKQVPVRPDLLTLCDFGLFDLIKPANLAKFVTAQATPRSNAPALERSSTSALWLNSYDFSSWCRKMRLVSIKPKIFSIFNLDFLTNCSRCTGAVGLHTTVVSLETRFFRSKQSLLA